MPTSPQKKSPSVKQTCSEPCHSFNNNCSTASDALLLFNSAILRILIQNESPDPFKAVIENGARQILMDNKHGDYMDPVLSFLLKHYQSYLPVTMIPKQCARLLCLETEKSLVTMTKLSMVALKTNAVDSSYTTVFKALLSSLTSIEVIE
jgi:hypothetical protein